MAIQKFNNNMFQFEDFDMTGIMNPELVDIMEMRKEANLARGNATDQYEADVADFKNIQATEAEQGIASLPNAPQMPESLKDRIVDADFFPSLQDLPTVPNIDYTNFNPTLFGQPFITPDITFEDIDYTNIPEVPVIPNIPTFVDNPYTEVFDTPTPEPDPFANLPDLGVVDFPDFNFDIPELGIVNVDDTISTMPVTDDIIDVNIPVSDTPVSDKPLPDYPFVDPETGGDYVFIVGDPINPGPGVVVRNPETGELPPGVTSGGVFGPAGTIPPTEVYMPRPPTPPARIDNVMAGYTRPMDPSVFGSTPGFEDSPLRPKPTGMKGGGRVPMGNNNMLNTGLSRLPLNQQNDTLTQVFQSGFRPRR